MSSPELGAHEGDRAAPADDGDSYATVRRRMDHLLDLLRGSIESRSFAPPAPWLTLDLSETEQAYTVVAELPGIEARDIELTLQDNILILRGVKRDERSEAEGERIYLERSYGRFERAVPFADAIDADQVQANSRNGVLTITLPKNPDATDNARRIEIRRADD